MSEIKTISDSQLAKMLTKAADPAEFSAIPADKAIIAREGLITILANLKDAREEREQMRAWMDVAMELADDLRGKLGLDNFEDAEEGSSLYKFHELAVGVPITQ